MSENGTVESLRQRFSANGGLSLTEQDRQEVGEQLNRVTVEQLAEMEAELDAQARRKFAFTLFVCLPPEQALDLMRDTTLRRHVEVQIEKAERELEEKWEEVGKKEQVLNSVAAEHDEALRRNEELEKKMAVMEEANEQLVAHGKHLKQEWAAAEREITRLRTFLGNVREHTTFALRITEELPLVEGDEYG